MPGACAHYDTAVVGGGIIGAACAYALFRSKPQRRLALVEPGPVGGKTTAAAAGLVSLLTKRPDTHMPLAAESLRLHEEWRSLVPGTQAHHNGLLLVFDTRQEADAADRLLEDVRRFEPWVKRLGPEEVWDMEPRYIGKRFGALYSAESFRVDARRLAERWIAQVGPVEAAAAPSDAGPDRLLLRAAAGRAVPAGDRWALHTSAGEISARHVVIAAGADTAGLLAPLGWSLPIRSRRGQIAVTLPMPGYLTRSIVAASYLTAKFDDASPPAPGEDSPLDYSFTAVVDDAGRVRLGSTRRFADDDSLREDERVRILHGAGLRLEGFSIDWVESEHAGRRPWTPDGLPLIGPLPELSGLYVAAGHEGDGVVLAPVTGEIIADMIDRRPQRMDAGALRPDRFGRVWMPADSQSDTA
jgi:sarcosine oxidase subunit beta